MLVGNTPLPPLPPLPLRVASSTQATDEIAQSIGAQIRQLRLRANLKQAAVAAMANVSISALKSVESGKGATLNTFIKVLRALGHADWLATLSPQVSVSPLAMLAHATAKRQRASSRRKKSSGEMPHV